MEIYQRIQNENKFDTNNIYISILMLPYNVKVICNFFICLQVIAECESKIIVQGSEISFFLYRNFHVLFKIIQHIT